MSLYAISSSVKAQKNKNPATRRWQGSFLKYNLLGVRRANCFAIHATAEVTAGWASHVRQRWRTAVRAGNSLHGRSLPIGATRMSISARGLVLWQCHNLSSISFNRLSLSVLYITASAIHYSETHYMAGRRSRVTALYSSRLLVAARLIWHVKSTGLYI